MPLIVCDTCHRHVRPSTEGCPFCGASLQQPALAPLPRWLGALLLGGLAITGCGDDGSASDDEGETSTTNAMMDADTETTAETTADTAETTTDTSAEMSTDTLGEETTNGEDDNGGSFYAGPAPDFLDIPECDPWAQDCPDGEKCTQQIDGENGSSNVCVPITGDDAPGEPCTSDGPLTGSDSCSAGAYCLLDANDEGTCVPYCEGSPDQPVCAEGSACSITDDGTLTICLPTCDPIAQDCGDADGCYWSGQDFLCYPTFAESVGEPCTSSNACAPGLYCVGEEFVPACEGNSCCTNFCELDNPQCELEGMACTAFFSEGEAPEGQENLGICVTEE
ncbi:hypothetical protein G6O69_26785 [Pseudenhygromyxa sp. WMMC2535]|uniref:hypothetical protein n=1 Tax=Pseudenhygromyxa sp. WMMC2535 TaxID=2712867 RepID=UPI0015531B00|nr:hypothetical protein [Pseudenhygromyxa sp. WMMC2535]NVB41473.1 hypothetical protein [Pseudenhygromyxa sp. WMMC2535]